MVCLAREIWYKCGSFHMEVCVCRWPAEDLGVHSCRDTVAWGWAVAVFFRHSLMLPSSALRSFSHCFPVHASASWSLFLFTHRKIPWRRNNHRERVYESQRLCLPGRVSKATKSAFSSLVGWDSFILPQDCILEELILKGGGPWISRGVQRGCCWRNVTDIAATLIDESVHPGRSGSLSLFPADLISSSFVLVHRCHHYTSSKRCRFLLI